MRRMRRSLVPVLSLGWVLRHRDQVKGVVLCNTGVAVPAAERMPAPAPRVGDAVFATGRDPSGQMHASFGHVGAELLTLASILRIPVPMHNVPEEDVFRPSAWANLGTADPEGADFRACATFGPLYGRR